MEYSSLSKDLTRNLSSTIKKENGIYFTPPSCVNSNIELLKPYMAEIKHILEPSCGSGEFITSLKSSFSGQVSITGIEYNETIYNSILQLDADNVSILKQDYLTFTPSTKYDLIIGNPPFYVMKKDRVDKIYYPYFDGRPNIFILFIMKSLELLNDNGILSFILPKNFLNCLYYDKTRNYISKNCQILNIVERDDKFIDTQQETIILIVRKLHVKTDIDNKKYILSIHSYTIFVVEDNMNMNMNKILKLYEKSKTLYELGFTVSVGNVVWNQCKDILTDDATKTRLIYCSDIVDNKLSIKTYKNGNKKNYIDKPGTIRPMIVINRGYGVGEYKFNYCLINECGSYLVENHLICIEYNNNNESKNIEKTELIKMYEKIIKSLNDKRTQEFIKLYFGNNAINTTELSYILPIYYDI
jgi:type I restriction-modification system DNA methylase subunit